MLRFKNSEKKGPEKRKNLILVIQRERVPKKERRGNFLLGTRMRERSEVLK